MDGPRIRPLYPVRAPSPPSSPYASSSNVTSFPSPSVMSDRTAAFPSSPSTTSSAPQSAPLPSPAADQRSFFFASLNNHTSPQTHPPHHLQSQQQQNHYLSLPGSYQAPPAQPPQSPAGPHFPQHPFPQQQQQQQHQPPPQQQAVPSQMQTGHSMPDRKAAGATNPETVAFLRDYNLVAEAAKRAQVACMIRDLDAMDMSQ